MNKTVKFYWFVVFLSCMCNLKNVFSQESIPVHYKGKYSSDIKDYEIVFPQRVNKDGSFISHLVSHHHSKRSTEELEFIFYKIPISGKDYLIELTPNRKLISPGAVVEIHREDVRKSASRQFLNKSSNNEKSKRMFKNLDIRKLENTDCHFSGHVKGENTSKAALSTCYGLAGFIQIHKGFYTIEPVAEHNPFLEDAYPHILYKTDGLDNSSVCHTVGEFAAALVDRQVRKRRESNLGLSTPIYIETLIVMDKTLINHYQNSDCENYILTVFNMAFNLFHDASSGLMMTLTLVRLIRLEVENDEMNFKVNADAEKTLRYFQTWQYEINPGDDSHPNHHDIALLVTRVNVCYSPSACGLLGLTTIGKGCDPKLSAALCEDRGLRLGYVIAHEIGHLLGADHDSVNSTCNGTDADGLKTVMHPHVSTTAQTWSSCSQAYFKEFFGSGMGICFFDEPEEHHFNVQDLLPGAMYNADFQCKHLITMGARECSVGSSCESLNCYVPGYACILTHAPPADGTHCGENMWCHEGKCLVVGERPGAIDGNWGEWSAWSDCSRTCGSGVTSSLRNCDKPQPSRGGKNCVGERKRYKICAATITMIPQNISDLIRFISEEVNVSFVGKPCQTGRPSFRDIQCGEFDDWIYPEDGKTHTWKAYFLHDDNPCTLYCINEEMQVAALRPRVVDGTMCYRGIRDICIAGTCKSLPCDLHFESNAVEDACGICHGDGTNCEFSEGKETFSKLTKGLTKLINVPSGTRNIKVEEMSPTLAKIIVRDKDTKDIYVRGKSLGMFTVPGSQAWLGMIKKNQEALNIPGPITKPLSIWIQRLDNVTVKWSMALPAEQQRKPEFAWDFLKWGPCSAICGPGTQKSVPSCMEEKAGLVEDSFCADLEMPNTKVRQCEVTKCVSRWMVGDWKGCESTSEKKERKRVVYCIKPIGEGEGESQIVSDSECVGPKPHEKEPCEKRKKREDTEYSIDGNILEPDFMQFKSDTSEFGFHKKYEVYLKHFAALSVPQRNSETIPFHLVSSPHFKHYFHVLETPPDSEADSFPDFDVSLPNMTSYDAEAQSKVSPDFLTETFSGHQIGVTHVHSIPQESTNPPEHRAKKNVNLDLKPKLKVSSTPRFKLRVKEGSKTKQDIDSKRKHQRSKQRFDIGRGRQIRFIKNFENFPAEKVKPESFSKKKHKGSFNYVFRNLTDVLETLRESDRSRFSNLINKSKAPELPSFERAKLRKYEWGPVHSPKTFSQKLNCFFSFFSKNKANSKENHDTFDGISLKEPIKPNNKEFDGSGLKRLPLPNEGLRENLKNSDLQNFIKKGRSFDCLHSKKFFKDRYFALDDFLMEKKNKKYHRKKKFLKEKRMPKGRKNKLKFIKKLKPQRPYKEKRSSRIWKKPKSKDANSKSGKEQSGTCGGTETKNYLNNLFRDNHPKIFNPKPTQISKPQEFNLRYKKPVIKEGALVIDQDLAENQEIEIASEEDEAESKEEKFTQLPQPIQNGKKLVISGQRVFDLLHQLQSCSARKTIFRKNTSSGEKNNTNGKTSKPETERKGETSQENSKSTTEVISSTVTTAATDQKTTNKTEKSSQNPHQETHTANSTTKNITQTEESTTESVESNTTEKTTVDDSDVCDYEVDEVVVESPETTAKAKKDKKKKKKKKKKKEKEITEEGSEQDTFR